MNLYNFAIFLSIWLCFCREAIAVNKNIATTGGFIIYRTISITQQSCNCQMSFSCSCCQSVIILYTKKRKDLCVNFTYQRNGLNVDVSLSSDTINTRTVTNYKAFQFCIFVPGCLFSTACINILELNQFPKSITICLRLDIYAKKQLWQINYDCLSLSTELPMMPASATTRMIHISNEGITRNVRMGESSMTEPITAMASTQMLIMEMSEINTTETVGVTKQSDRITEISEMNSEQIIAD